MKIIALEEAFTLPEFQARQASPAGMTDPKWVSEWDRRLVDFTGERIECMDKYGIDVQVLSLTVPGIQPITDTAQAIDDAQKANDFLAAVVAENPERFRGFAAVPLQDPEAAVKELDRAIGDLGFCGVLVNDHTCGHYYDEPQFEPFWTRLEELDVPLYIHPGSSPVEMWKIIDQRPQMIGPVWTWGAEAAGHALRLVFGGVFDRHTSAKVILGHMGEFLPFQLSRIDSRYFRQRDRVLSRKPSEYFGDNIHITTSGVWSHAALQGAIDSIGVDAVMFSVDYPFEFTSDAVEFLRSAPLSDDDMAKVSHRNAEALLKI